MTVHTIMLRLLDGRLWFILPIAFVAACSVPLNSTAIAESYSFQDEFTGPGGVPPDPAKWSFVTGGGGWGNGELQTYTNSRENSFLDGQGNLVIRATKTTTREDAKNHVLYKSARLTTLHHFSQQY